MDELLWDVRTKSEKGKLVEWSITFGVQGVGVAVPALAPANDVVEIVRDEERSRVEIVPALPAVFIR